MNSRMKYLIVFSSTCLMFLLLIGSMLGKSSSPDDSYRHLAVYTEVLSRIKSEYVEEPDMKSVTLGALNGLLEAVDPCASYLSADQYKAYLKDQQSAKADVGLVLARRYGYVGVVAAIAVEGRSDDSTAPAVRLSELTPTAAPAGTLSSTWYCAAGSATGATSGEGAGPAEQTVIVSNASDTASSGVITLYPEGAAAKPTLSSSSTTVTSTVGLPRERRICRPCTWTIAVDMAGQYIRGCGGVNRANPPRLRWRRSARGPSATTRSSSSSLPCASPMRPHPADDAASCRRRRSPGRRFRH